MVIVAVDRALAVIDCYHQKITKYELEILSRPKMRTVKLRLFLTGLLIFYAKHQRHLVHILSGDLILHKRTLEPVKTMVYGLRRYDLDRCAALIDATDPKNKDQQIAGFMSHKAKIYLVCPLIQDKSSSKSKTRRLMFMITRNTYWLAWIRLPILPKTSLATHSTLVQLMIPGRGNTQAELSL